MGTGDKFSAKDELLIEKIITGVSEKVNGYIFNVRDRVFELEKQIAKLPKNGHKTENEHKIKKPTTGKTIALRVGIAVLCAIAVAALPSLFRFLSDIFSSHG